ncbi:MAG: zinc ribbon domain-containing protein, partial [Thermoplasmata archaeon]|nr:zinc ribbon domain-containing protein [Thermoplasmata archaeon]
FEYSPGERFVRCSYCDTMIFIDKSGVMFYYVIPFRIDEKSAELIFRRWASGPMKARGLENAWIREVKKYYFPVYRFVRDVGGREVVLVRPAKSTLLPGMNMLKIPPGDMKIFDYNFSPGDAEVLQPDLTMGYYLPALEGKAREQALVYFPIYHIRYSFLGGDYEAVVDGSTGEVFSSYFPPREVTPYRAVAVASYLLSLAGGVFGLLMRSVLGLYIIAFAFIVGGVGGYYVSRKY